MAFLTEARARGAARYQTRSLVEAELRKSAAAHPGATFDVFLSHSYLDAPIILGVKTLLEAEGLTVYVDWIEDPQLDRSHVTTRTADFLRTRMRHSASLIFATSESSSQSKWMPWELGYFDGFRPGHVAILPLVQEASDDFKGQEYLGLYPYIEDIKWTGGTRGFGISTSRTEARTLSSLVPAGFHV
jgi:TIR domain